ncbi:hypothetical protein CPC08DRAFT_708923 [Agrocybe pediades]|nr:hypothetical protein CPC08DRAFT_708923 [Agrocybe pediades]
MTVPSSYPALEPALKLDPGPPPRKNRRTRRGLIYRLFCKSLMLLALSLLGYGSMLMIRRLLSVPHKEMYHRVTDETSLDKVVKPLITEDQTFDIVATVWLRDDSMLVDEPATTNAGIEGSRSKVLRERAIFSDTVFRGVKITDRGLKTSVKLEIPTAIFKKAELSNTDLRASFVLVPNEPSPIDRITNYSGWVPADAMYPPFRNYSHDHKPSLAEKVIDAYGASAPLLSFNNIKSRCALPDDGEGRIANVSDGQVKTNKASKRKEEKTKLQALLTWGKINKEEYAEEMWKLNFAENNTDVTTLGKAAHSSHPYIITKTFLTIMDMTKPLNRTAYEQAHTKLAETSCGLEDLKALGLPANRADWRLCKRSYKVNGNHEIMIQSAARDTDVTEKKGKDGSLEWLYAPYMEFEDFVGPLDLIPVPVDRENCTAEGSTVVNEDDTLSLTWNIVFSSRSPGLKILGFPFNLIPNGASQGYNMTADEETLKLKQSQVEFNQAAHGYKPYESQHPVLGYVIYCFDWILYVPEILLTLHYWYRRAGQSTVGILIVSSSLIQFVAAAILAYIESHSFVVFLFTILITSFTQTTTLIALKAISRAEIRRKWVFIPVSVRFAGATHAERASRRVESRTSWQKRLLILAFFMAILGLATLKDFYIIKPAIKIKSVPVPNSSLRKLVQTIVDFITGPMHLSGQVLQLVMNEQSGTFAGAYKVTVYLGFARGLLQLSSFLPWLGFFMTKRSAVPLFGLLQLFYYGALVFQARRYPEPKVVEEEIE